MKLIQGGSEPATREDIRELQKTIIASSLATMLTIIQAVEGQYYSPEESMKFLEDSKSLIDLILKNMFSGSPD